MKHKYEKVLRKENEQRQIFFLELTDFRAKTKGNKKYSICFIKKLKKKTFK